MVGMNQSNTCVDGSCPAAAHIRGTSRGDHRCSRTMPEETTVVPARYRRRPPLFPHDAGNWTAPWDRPHAARQFLDEDLVLLWFGATFVVCHPAQLHWGAVARIDQNRTSCRLLQLVSFVQATVVNGNLFLLHDADGHVRCSTRETRF